MKSGLSCVFLCSSKFTMYGDSCYWINTRNILVGTNYVIFLLLFLFLCTYRAFLFFIIYYL